MVKDSTAYRGTWILKVKSCDEKNQSLRAYHETGLSVAIPSERVTQQLHAVWLGRGVRAVVYYKRLPVAQLVLLIL